MRSTLTATVEALPSVPWAHLEVALWLLYALGEGLPEASLRQKGGEFEQLLVTLLSSPMLSAYPHRAVQLHFFEIAVRYYRFFLSRPDYLGTALAAFLDGRGLGNPNTAVRSRACYLLLRFVKQTIKSARTASTLSRSCGRSSRWCSATRRPTRATPPPPPPLPPPPHPRPRPNRSRRRPRRRAAAAPRRSPTATTRT